MDEWVDFYLDCGFPLIPLRKGTKCPVARGWDRNFYKSHDFKNRNIGTRAGEKVRLFDKEGYLLIVDFDSADLSLLKEMCGSIPLPRTTCVRTGGQHNGYHLFYLTDYEISKKGMLSYKEASVDLLGTGSYAVIPPSEVDSPYKYLLGLKEISFLEKSVYDLLLSCLTDWKQANSFVKKVLEEKISYEKAFEKLRKNEVRDEAMTFFTESLHNVDITDV